MNWRIWFFRVIFGLAFLALGANLYQIQVNKRGDLVSKARAQNEALGILKPSRGLIFATDKNNNFAPLVLNKGYPVIYASPVEIQDAKEAAAMVSPVIGQDVDSLVKIFSKPKNQYALLVEKASDDQVQKIKELGIKGIYVKSETFRAYPFGTMAAQVLGFISSAADGRLAGRYGIELQFNDELSGTDGTRDAGAAQNPSDGRDLYLTIDYNVQNQLEQMITALNKEWRADGTSAIVQEPVTGKILAMAVYPTFDPNEYSQYPIKDFLNPNLQLSYEPGSVFKIITMAAGIDSGKITPDTTYYDTGTLKLDNKWTISNWDYATHGPWGRITMTNVIEHSLNVGAVFAQRQTGNDIFTDYVKRFGFGQKSGIQLPGELAGDLRNLDNGRSSNYATASYGQGITVTPVQLVTAFSAVANGGVLMKPLILADEKPQVVGRVISQETAKKLTDMMVSAVDINQVAAVSQYRVAGKTGTAFTTEYNVKGYNKDKVINSYIGFAPASNPKFTILIKLDNPQNAPLAGQTVVPAFREMAEFLLNYYNIAPDRQSGGSGQ